MSLISVIIPVYNGAPFIARAVDSALAQDFSDFEVIVVDDGSTDATIFILSKYGDKIRVLRQDNRGAAVARNAGAAVARGEYLAFLDADDWWREDKLALTHQALQGDETAVLAFSGFRELLLGEIELDDRRYEKAPSLEEILAQFLFIPTSTVMIRHSVFKRIGGFCEELRSAAYEDTYLLLLAREHGEFIYIDELLMSRRVRVSYCDERWWLNAKKFERLVLARYGRRALPMLQRNEDLLASMALREVGIQFRMGNPTAALRWWIEAARLQPWEAVRRAAKTIPHAAARLYRRRDASSPRIS
jgi:glycosyltransferase involved in cell wall biosynthesis